jgi:hypothetical protein
MHGTGTALGDPIEVTAACGVLLPPGRQLALSLSAVKSYLGHTEGAAGTAGMVQVRYWGSGGGPEGASDGGRQEKKKMTIGEGDLKGWSTVLITALGSWEKPVPRDHRMCGQWRKDATLGSRRN